jgi:hypothetical protein
MQPLKVLNKILRVGGDHAFGPVVMPDDVSTLIIRVDVSEHLDPAIFWSIELEVSYDNGVTWRFAGGASRTGGQAVDMEGNPISEATLTVPFQTGVDRRLRGTLNQSAGLRLSIDVEAH